ncbi:MAG: asparaginase [Planctomycetia bacterium]|nr:asparaginase [Planctomycetia bacterium]
MSPHPLIVEVTRGQRVESIHRGSVAVVDCRGAAVFLVGDTKALVYPRSAVKPIQALPLVASGAADAIGATDAEIALACGSHVGSPLHAATAESLLRRAGQTSGCLECGAHWPFDEAEARALAARHESPSALHNNCSGKHAGIICSSCFLGHSPTGYTRPDHPAMREVTAALAAVTGADLDPAAAATDGCSIPAFAMPLESLALGFARIGTAVGLPDSLKAATVRIRSAIAAQPVMLAGAGRFDTRVAEECGEAILVKSGAEGVACAAIPALGLGIAVKIDDGAGRAATAAMASLLIRLATDWLEGQASARSMLEEFSNPVLRNWNGEEVGHLRSRVPMP